MEKSVEKDASSYDRSKERRITRSMAKSCKELQVSVLDSNNQVISKKRKTRKEMLMLPLDILFKIFLVFPVKFLQEVVALVCRRWREVIRDPDFTIYHQSNPRNNPILSVVRFHNKFEVYSIKKERNTWEFNTKVNLVYITHDYGLILAADYFGYSGCYSHSNVYLFNPTTNQILKLPQKRVIYTESLWAVGYSPSTSQHKVFCFVKSSNRAYISTVGVDKKWREILFEGDKMTCTTTCSSYIRSGCIYILDSGKKCVIVLDLEKETFYKVRFLEGMSSSARVIKSDSIMCIAIAMMEDKCWHFWELVDYKNGGKWRKLGSIAFESKGFSRTSPQFLMSRDEVIFWCNLSNSLFACNFKLGTVIRSFPTPCSDMPKSYIFMNNLAVLPDYE